MGLIDLFNHLLNFVLPAVTVGLAVALFTRFSMRKMAPAHAVLAQAAINSVAGALALALALWFFGRDGKMASFGAMVLVVASCQWVCAKGWRG